MKFMKQNAKKLHGEVQIVYDPFGFGARAKQGREYNNYFATTRQKIEEDSNNNSNYFKTLSALLFHSSGRGWRWESRIRRRHSRSA